MRVWFDGPEDRKSAIHWVWLVFWMSIGVGGVLLSVHLAAPAGAAFWRGLVARIGADEAFSLLAGSLVCIAAPLISITAYSIGAFFFRAPEWLEQPSYNPATASDSTAPPHTPEPPASRRPQ